MWLAVAPGACAAKVSANGILTGHRWPRKDSLMNDDTRLRDGLAPSESPQESVAAAGPGFLGASLGGQAFSEAGHSPGAGTGVYAALDLGTNNCRLLIACPSGDS